MNAVARQGKRVLGGTMDVAGEFLWPIIIIAVVLVIIWQGVTAIGEWHRGIYAGFHYTDARKVAINSLVSQYGRDEAAKFRLAEPPVVNSHSRSLFVSGQVRVFHLIGPRGTRYCVSVWNPRYNWTGDHHTGIDLGGDAKIDKGCKF